MPAPRDGLGRLLQIAGLTVMLAAFLYGVQGGSVYSELLAFGAGVGLILMGRSLRAA